MKSVSEVLSSTLPPRLVELLWGPRGLPAEFTKRIPCVLSESEYAAIAASYTQCDSAPTNREQWCRCLEKEGLTDEFFREFSAPNDSIRDSAELRRLSYPSSTSEERAARARPPSQRGTQGPDRSCG